MSVRNNAGATPLHLACEYGYKDIVKVTMMKTVVLKISKYATSFMQNAGRITAIKKVVTFKCDQALL